MTSEGTKLGQFIQNETFRAEPLDERKQTHIGVIGLSLSSHTGWLRFDSIPDPFPTYLRDPGALISLRYSL